MHVRRHTAFCWPVQGSFQNLSGSPRLRQLQAKAGRPLAGQGTLQQMSIDARLEDLKRDLARLGERGGSTKMQLPPGGRGREADHPGDSPLRGWKDILWRS